MFSGSGRRQGATTGATSNQAGALLLLKCSSAGRGMKKAQAGIIRPGLSLSKWKAEGACPQYIHG